MVSLQRANLTIFIVEEEGTFDIIAKGAFRKLRVLPDPNILLILDNPAHALN